MQYSADQIIGKTLQAVSPVPIRRAAMDSSPVVYTVPTGQPVGVVTSFLLPKLGRNTLYWEFKDSAGRFYYTPQAPGMYNVQSLENQGAITVKEATAAAAAAANPPGITDFIQKNLRFIVIVAGIAIIAKTVLPELIKRK